MRDLRERAAAHGRDPASLLIYPALVAVAGQTDAEAQANAMRSEAEKLVVYLIDDFYLELAPVGRLDTLADLSKRALDYYANLPPTLRTAETERNRALAQVRYG